MGTVHAKQIDFNFEETCEKLASLYAKCKLEEAISTQKFLGNAAPVEIEQMEYLAEEYYSSLGYFANLTEDYIKYLVDHE
jgi:hypothetical protein